MASTDFLLDNHLTDDIVNIFFPMNLVLSVLFAAKYTIRDNYITPTSSGYKISVYIILVLVIVVKSYTLIFEHNLNAIVKQSGYLKMVFVYHFLFSCISTSTFFILNEFTMKTNIILVLKIQKIQDIIRNNNSTISAILWNCFLCLVISSHVILAIFYHFTASYFNLRDALIALLKVGLLVSYYYSIRVVFLLANYLEQWNSFIMKMNKNKDIKKMFEVYRKILKAFKLFKCSSELLTFLWYFQTFTYILTHFKILLEIAQLKHTVSYNTRTTLITIIWSTKDLLLVIILCVGCEKFYIAVEDAKMSCLLHTKKATCSESHKRLCKKVLKYNRASFSKMTVCGLFDLDAVLPLHLLLTLTNYIIVMLQFALL